MKIGHVDQNALDFCILAKIANFEYFWKKFDFSANRCLLMLVLGSIQTRINSA